MIDWMWGAVGAIVGTVLGITGGTIGVWNCRRIARGQESFLKVKKWNIYDSLYTAIMIVGLLTLVMGLLSIRFNMIDDSYALVLFSLVFLFAGSLNAIIRVRVLQT
jgi:hypothetical protein